MPRDRADVDDHAAAPRAHVRNGHELRHAEHREKVQLHQPAHFLHGRVPGGPVEADAGIVDQDVDGAVAFQGALHHPAAVLFAGEIAGVIRASGPPAARRPSSERAVSESLAPARANSAAQAAPMPWEAPVMSTTLPSIFMSQAARREGRHCSGFGVKRHNVTMPSRLIPLFPLQVVVFPRTALPLHIFEERYKEMVGNAIRDNSEFGVVLANDEGIVNAGCTVVVEKVLADASGRPHGHSDARPPPLRDRVAE